MKNFVKILQIYWIFIIKSSEICDDFKEYILENMEIK